MKSLTGVKIFATGIWNRQEWTKRHLKSMAEAFKALKNVHRVPLKFGHNKDQKMTDGLPALGWVDNVYLSNDGETLLADFADMPDIVYKAIKSKLYRKLSIEMRQFVSYKAQQFESVLAGVALLGADIPAVNTLGDLEKYIPEGFTAEDEVLFELEDPLTIKEEGKKMPDNIEERLAKFQAQLDQQAEENKALRKQNEELKSERDKVTKDFSDLSSTIKKQQVEEARQKIVEVFDSAVKDQAITPAQRTAYFNALKVNDDDAVVNIKMEEVKAMLPTDKMSMFAEDKGKNDEQSFEAPDDQITVKAYELMAGNSKLDFSAAAEQVMRSNPALAAAYRDMNYEGEEA